VFIGGFDPLPIGDEAITRRFLLLTYPVGNHDELRSRIGSIDLNAPPSNFGAFNAST
jgi:hypothetical protein